MPSSWRSRRKLVSNSANTPSISRKHLPAAVPVSIGCSVAFSAAPLALSARMMSWSPHIAVITERLSVASPFNPCGAGERPMDDAAAVYQLRAEECLAVALDARDEVHRTEAVEMALYWFEQAEQAEKTVTGSLPSR